MRSEVEEKGLRLSITEVEKEKKSNVIASRGCLEERFQDCSKQEGVGLAALMQTLGVDWRTKAQQQLGANRLARKADVRCEVPNCQRESRLSEERNKLDARRAECDL